ncbi:MAG: hypothetical protein K2P95_04055, partial [Hyphomonadaceae bacterium]|nr:hypothetical protein [Hyphomonadaceae bacterium]
RAAINARQEAVNAAVTGFNTELQGIEAMRSALGAQVEAANAKNAANAPSPAGAGRNRNQ